jgi:hypothetical protein
MVMMAVGGSYISNLVFKHLDEFVKDHCDDRAGSWADPVDPVFSIKYSRNNAWSKRSCWIERAAGVVDAY